MSGTENRDSHPNADSEARLSGDMGLSSERDDDFEGVEGTGTLASSQGATDGESPTHPDDVEVTTPTHRQQQEEEENAAEVFSQQNDPAKNPGHSHG